MANSIVGNTHIIDTADAGLIVTNAVHIKRVRWVGATTAGHQAIIQDSGSRVMWEDIAPGANYACSDSVDEDSPGGYKVTTLGSGRLYVTFG